MSVWSRIAAFLSTTAGSAGDALASVMESVRTLLEGDPQTRRQVAFSIAMIALSAKMAKADGIVTPVEVDAFRQIFAIPDEDAGHVARLYNLAKQDVAGFGVYARRVRDLFPGDPDVREDVMDGLFHIAKADGIVHEKEMEFLDRVAAVFGIEGRDYERIRLRHLHPEAGNPYVLIEAQAGWDGARLKAHYRTLVKQHHPDQLMARGLPAEFIAIANSRLAAINTAWDAIRTERGL